MHEHFVKYFETIAELHKLGYEKFRVCASLSPNGAGYRCVLTVKQNCWNKNGLFCNPFDNEFTIETHNCNLPWDCIALTPQENALRIIKEFPDLAHYALGRDTKYVEWFKLVVEECHKEHYFYAFDEWNNVLRDGYTPITGVDGKRLPLPPVGDSETQTMY